MPKKIASNYFYGKFWIDLISTIPVEKVVQPFIAREVMIKYGNETFKVVS